MVQTTMVQRTLVSIVLFAYVFDCANAVHIGNAAIELSIENCTLSDLKGIDKWHESTLNQNIPHPVRYLFTNCKISILPNDFFIHVPSVRSIEFRDANISKLEPFALSEMNDLEVLKIVGNANLTEIPVGFFDFPINITILNLAWNLLTRIDSFTFKPLLQLIDLNLSYNRISYIDPYSFSTTARLEILRLNGNQISTLSSMVYHNLAHLEYLNLSENALSNEAFENKNIFQQNVNLLNLDISHNAITTFPMNIFSELRALKVRFSSLFCPTDIHFTTVFVVVNN